MSLTGITLSTQAVSRQDRPSQLSYLAQLESSPPKLSLLVGTVKELMGLLQGLTQVKPLLESR